MPTYEYKCKSCNKRFDIYSSIRDYEQIEECEYCGKEAELQISGGSGFVGEKVEHEEWNPGLGCVVKNSAHRKQICKERGLIEVGNENMDKQHDIMDADLKKRLNARWDD